MKRFSVFLLAWFAFSGALLAQAQSNTADLSGVIRDQTSGILPGVSVSVTQLENGFTRAAVSDEEGNYRVLLLPPGPYEVRAELPGFATKVFTGVVLTVGQYANLDITLEVSASQTEVFVSANADIVEPEKTVQASTIAEMEIDNLPINGRNYLDFTLLTPGATDKQNFVNAKAVQAPTSGLSFSGQDQRSNYVTIDGADNMDVLSNSVRSTLSQEAIQEFQISRNTFSAEFGRARAGIINIVSKSGSNDLHGNAFFFFRNNSLDARNTFAFGPGGTPIDPPFERYQWGASLGGPIIRDRTFFFLNYERLDRDESIFVTFLENESIFQATQSQQDLFGFLDSTGIFPLKSLAGAFIDPDFGLLNTTEVTYPDTLQLFRDESGVFPFAADSDTVSFKLDHQISQNNQFFSRVNFTDSFDDGQDFGALEAVSNGVRFDTRDLSWVASDTQVFSPRTLNDFKFQYARREFSVATNDPVGPEIIIAGVAEFGREFFNPSQYTNNIFQFVDNLSLVRGDHNLKLGVDVNILEMSGFAEVFLGGQFSFAERVPLADVMNNLLGPGTASGLINQLETPVERGGLGRPDLVSNVLKEISPVQSFNLGLPISYFQGFGNADTSFTFVQYGFYLQDSWKVRNNLTLNLGIRYDGDRRAKTLNIINDTPPFATEFEAINDRNNFAPRLGFAWDLAGNAVIRGGYGIYYQNFFQGVAFVSQVLAGQQLTDSGAGISQVFLPLTGLPGFDVTSQDLYGFFAATGEVGEAALGAFDISPGTTPSIILPADSNAVNPYSHHVSFGYERALTPNLSISLDYILNRGVHLIRSRDINLRELGPNRFQLSGEETLPGLDPRFVQVNMIETSASSIYHGFTLSLRKRFSDGYSGMLAYTLGKAIDDTTDFITQLQPNDQTNLAGERSLSSFDQRHRLVMNTVWQSPYRLASSNSLVRNIFADWTVAPIVTVSSGRPFNLLLGFDLNGDSHEETDRPVLPDGTVVGRNTGKGPDYFQTDLRVARKFQLPREEANLELIFEAFNLFNNVNYSGVNNVVGTLPLTTGVVEGSKRIPANQPLGFTAALAPRQIQFGFRLNF